MKKETPSFYDELLEKMRQEIADLNPALLGILKKGMLEGEKNGANGIDKIQLDSAKAASYIAQYYCEQLIGKPLHREEISGKNGSPLNVKLNFVLEHNKNNNGRPEQDSRDS